MAFLFVLARTYTRVASTTTRRPLPSSCRYYWHFVDVVWIALFATIYFIQ